MKTILLVDDEKSARELFKISVNWDLLDYVVSDEAKNGAEALKLFLEKDYDFVVTDIRMPVMDGLELIRQIRKINPKQKIAVLSCHESFDYAKQAFRLGVVDYLIKDYITHDEIENALQRIETSDEPSPSGDIKYSPRVSGVISYIENNLAEPINLLHLEQTFNVHRVHLSRQFKLETGCSPGSYIRNLRIEKAKAMLLKGQFTVSEIISQIGFRNSQSFYTAFKQITGVTPNEYRKKSGAESD